MSRLEDLRAKMARNPAQMSDGERMEFRFLEKQEEWEMAENATEYRKKYWEEMKKKEALAAEVAECKEKIKLQEATIQTLLAALQGKITG